MIRWQSLAATCLWVCLCGCSQPPRPFVPDLSGPAVPWTDRDFGDGGADFHFAIVADRNGGSRPGVFEGAVVKLNLLQPEFVICVGDLIGGYTDDAAELGRQQDEFDRIVGQLEMPFFHVPGNHDISNALAASAWRGRYGRPYYHFLYKGALFVVLCTEDPGDNKLLDEQLEYLRKVLEANKTVRWTFLFMHVPGLQGDGTSKPPWAKFEPLLEGRPWTAFAGHDHEYAIYDRHGNKYIRLGTTGGASDLLGKEFGSFDQVMWVTVRSDGPKIANLMLDGIQDDHVSTPEQVRQSYGLLEGVTLVGDVVPVPRGPLRPAWTQLTFTNKTDLPAAVTAVFQPDEKLLPSPPSMALHVAPKSDKAVDLLLTPATRLSLADVKPLTLAYSVSYQMPDGTSRKFDFSRSIGLAEVLPLRRAPRAILVDGQLDDWAGLLVAVDRPGQIQGDVEGYRGPDDCRFRFGVTYDEQYVYIAVDVTDDNELLDPNRPPDDQDAALILVGADPDMGTSSEADQRTYGILMCPWKEPPKPNVDTRGRKLRGTQRGSVRTAGGYTAELAIPVSELQKLRDGPWQEIRLNIAVRDRDGPDKVTELYWQADWSSPQAVYGSGTFRKEQPAPSSGPASTQADAAAKTSR
ncbi:MAG: metallophosphoesterase [Phycisphaerae bacterium]|nr:metallophosphoesterase [Phycisphaerae bacterium]